MVAAMTKNEDIYKNNDCLEGLDNKTAICCIKSPMQCTKLKEYL